MVSLVIYTAVMIDGSRWWTYAYKVFSKYTYDLSSELNRYKLGSVCKLKCQALMSCGGLYLMWCYSHNVWYVTVIASVLYLQV